MKPKSPKSKKCILSGGQNQLLEIKQLLDNVLTEAVGIPGEVRQSLSSARDSAWRSFKAEQEKTLNPQGS